MYLFIYIYLFVYLFCLFIYIFVYLFIYLLFLFELWNIISYRSLCESQQFLEQNIQKIIKNGGEGAILRKPKSIYESGRSSSLLKLKVNKKNLKQIIKNNIM